MRDFLQSKEWRDFQKSFGRKTFFVGGEEMGASIIEHELPLVGRYMYVPRGIYFCHPSENGDSVNKDLRLDSRLRGNDNITVEKIINLAKKEKAGWIRLDINNSETLEFLKNSTNLKIVKAPHDVQPKEVFIIDITKSEEDLLAEMKPKTRYNIGLSEKKGALVKEGKEYIEDFLRLTSVMAKRQGITPHSPDYYLKMFASIPREILRLYAAEYQGKVIAANAVVFYEGVATYLHGASDDSFRNVMAPYLLQWEGIKEAKSKGCKKYDFGGVDISGDKKSWVGITKFKLGFSAKTEPTRFLGSYDVVVDGGKYRLYKFIQRIKSIL